MRTPGTVEAWRDETGCVVVATAVVEPVSAGLPHADWIEPDLLIEADVVDPGRFVRLTAAVDGVEDGPTRLRLVERLLGIASSSLDQVPADGAPMRLAVDDDRIGALGRLAATGASERGTSEDPGGVDPWWAIETHAVAAALSTPEVGVGDPADLLDRVAVGRWVDLAGAAARATEAVSVVADLAGRPPPALAIVPAGPDDQPDISWVEPGVLPPLAAGQPVQVPLSAADAAPGVFDLSDGATVELADDGRGIDVAVTVAQGAYLQLARAHRVQVQRLDVDLIVGEAALEGGDAEHVAARVRLSRHTLGRPLSMRLFPRQQVTTATRHLVVARAASSQALAGAALGRLGQRDAAAQAFGRAAAWWRSIDRTELADAADAAPGLVVGPALLGEALRAR